VRATEAVRKQMSESYLLTVQTALREVEDSLVSRTKAGELVTAQARRLQSLKDVSSLARQRFEGGQSTYLEVLEADRQVLFGQDQQTQGLRDQYSALVSIYKAMGAAGWSSRTKQGRPNRRPRPWPCRRCRSRRARSVNSRSGNDRADPKDRPSAYLMRRCEAFRIVKGEEISYVLRDKLQDKTYDFEAWQFFILEALPVARRCPSCSRCSRTGSTALWKRGRSTNSSTRSPRASC